VPLSFGGGAGALPALWKSSKKAEAIMRIGSVILIIWLVIGLIAAAQRNYFNHKVSCASAGTVVVTILAGPLNYVGANPKLSCH
jgi:membrane protein YdbS with pleckstrin-like domain